MKTLVIGYGNDLRSDDGVGRAVADRIGGLGLPDVAVRSLSQLVPELALEITEADLVVFVDASIDAVGTTATPVVPQSIEVSTTTHFADPATLLGMTAAVGPLPSKAFVVSVPVQSLDLGFDLSPATAREVEIAVQLIANLIRSS